ncbi:MAG: AzlC family ABC transporter permease [Gemmobacter sp.]|nr:AzlC family ABC transporter permease [Gemmobacter sp.]MBL8561920.1 AzlC family ABC transporter permease [Gemmobacter sp.]
MIVPFGALFGVLATAQGMSVFEAMAFSVVVIAGASQFAALQMMQDGAPVLLIILTATAVNLRMAMYSVAMTPHLGMAPLWQRAVIAYFLVDQSFVLGAAEYERRPEWQLAEKLAWYAGIVTPICGLWYLATWMGATFGKAVPPHWPLDFIVPVSFLAMIAPILLTRAQMLAAAVSVGGTLALWWMPHSSGLLVAALAAMLAGAIWETREEARHAG